MPAPRTLAGGVNLGSGTAGLWCVCCMLEIVRKAGGLPFVLPGAGAEG